MKYTAAVFLLKNPTLLLSPLKPHKPPTRLAGKYTPDVCKSRIAAACIAEESMPDDACSTSRFDPRDPNSFLERCFAKVHLTGAAAASSMNVVNEK